MPLHASVGAWEDVCIARGLHVCPPVEHLSPILVSRPAGPSMLRKKKKKTKNLFGQAVQVSQQEHPFPLPLRFPKACNLALGKIAPGTLGRVFNICIMNLHSFDQQGKVERPQALDSGMLCH